LTAPEGDSDLPRKLHIKFHRQNARDEKKLYSQRFQRMLFYAGCVLHVALTILGESMAKAKKAKKAAPKKKANSAFMKKLKVSDALAEVIGAGDRARTEVVKALWKYIKKHDLQDSKNRRNIVADAKLKAVFGGKGVVNMFEMTKLVSKHLK
jgi:chromatin remodeling complex protein RSC6